MAEEGKTGERAAAGLRPLAHPWRRFWLLAVVVALCVVVSRAHIHAVGGDYLLRVFTVTEESVTEFEPEDVAFSEPGVVELLSVGPTETVDGLKGFGLQLRAIADGESSLTARLVVNGEPRDLELGAVRVLDGVIIANGIDFSGYEAIYASTLVVIAVALGLFVSIAWQLGRRAWYSYLMVATVGSAVYLVGQLVVFVALGLLGFVDSFTELANTYMTLASSFILVSIPVMGIMVVALALSNLSLVRHEGFRPQNLLGIILALAWAAVIVNLFIGSNYSGSFEEVRLHSVLEGLFASAISYGIALFLATVLCAWRSTRHRCAHDKDYLVILGCGLRDDGSPMPLLAGRIERALAFEREQYEATGRHATFVPSGGKGSDEIWSEAEAMRRYLVAAGVEEDRIICEDRSTNTRENMAFSRQRIDEARAEAGLATEDVDGFASYGVAFATTNYHVFRGYTYAHAAGLAAEGLGAKTRLYFWPNAFLREFAGLLVAERASILALYLVVALAQAATTYALFW